MRKPYVPTYTRDRLFLGSAPSAGYQGMVHAWFEALTKEGRPRGSRALCGVRSTSWCRDWDGFPYVGLESIQQAKSVSWLGRICPDCLAELNQ